MNPPYFHLLINVIPVLGSLSGLLLLGYGLVKSSRKYDRLAYVIFVITTIGTIGTYISGHSALDAIRGSQGISQQALTTHQYIAHGALASMLILGFFSLWALYSSRKDREVSDTLNYIILGAAFVSFAITVSTAMQGVEIRYHDPVEEASSNPNEIKFGFEERRITDLY